MSNLNIAQRGLQRNPRSVTVKPVQCPTTEKLKTSRGALKIELSTSDLSIAVPVVSQSFFVEGDETPLIGTLQ